MKWKFGDKLYYAQLKQKTGIPPTARIIEATYHSPGKKFETIRIKAAHSKYPLIAKTADVARTPEISKVSLQIKIANAVNQHQTAIRQLYDALDLIDQHATVVFPGEKIIRTKELPMKAKPANVDTLAKLKHLRDAETSRKTLQSRLIAAHQRARSHNPPGLKHVTGHDPRQNSAEIPAEIEPLTLSAEKTIPTAAPVEQSPPIDPPTTRPITTAPHENDTRPKRRPTRKPPARS
jgi:hypothetical protein